MSKDGHGEPYQLLDTKHFTIQPKHNYVFEQADDAWLITFEGKTANVKNSKGMKNIACLLEKSAAVFDAHELMLASGEITLADGCPNEERHTDDDNPSCNGEDVNARLDPTYVASIKTRLKEIKEELASAKERDDVERGEKLEEEQESILKLLRKDTKPSGGSKSFGTVPKKKRDSVRQNINQAIEYIREQHPELATHFSKYITKGKSFYYKSTQPIEWRVHILR